MYTKAGLPKNGTSTVPIWAKLLCHLLVRYRDFGCAQQIIQLKFYVSHRHRDSMNQLSYELRYRQSFQKHIAPKKLFWSMQKQILKFHCTVGMFLFKKVMVSLFVGSIPGDSISARNLSWRFTFTPIMKSLNFLSIYSKDTGVLWYVSLDWIKLTPLTSISKLPSFHNCRCRLRYSVWSFDFEVQLLFWNNKDNIIIINLTAAFCNWLFFTHLCITRVCSSI